MEKSNWAFPASKALALFRFFSLFILLSQLSPSNCQLAPSTIYSGITYNYNTYLQFGGNAGIMVNQTISNLQTYSMSIWLKFDQLPWGALNRDMCILQFSPSAFAINALRSNGIEFDSDKGSPTLLQGDIRSGQWYIITVTSYSSGTQIYLKTLSNSVIDQQKYGTFYPLGFQTLSFTSVYLGIRKDGTSSSFLGSIRNFKLFQVILSDASMYSVQFIKLYPSIALRMQVLMNYEGDFRNEVGLGQGAIVGDNPVLPAQHDFMGTFWCWNPTLVFPEFVDNSLFNFQPFQMTSSSKTSNYNTATVVEGTVQMWIKRRATYPQTETVFSHNRMIDLSITPSNYDNLTFVGRLQSVDQISQQIRFNIWHFVQAGTSGAQIAYYVADNNGQKISYTQKTYTLSQNFQGTTTSLAIGNDFQGFIKGIKYYKSFLTTQTAVSMNYGFVQQTSDPNLMFYFLLQGSGYDSNNNYFSNMAFANFDNNLKVGSGSVQFIQSFWFEMNQQTSLEGTYNSTLTFDGYTCLNNKTRLQMGSSSSSVSTTIKLNSSLSSFAFEFWIKLAKSTAQTSVLLTLAEYYSQTTVYLSVRIEQASLYCYPSLGNGEKLQYTDYSGGYVWQHVSCVYDGAQRSISGTFFQNNNDYSYTQKSQQSLISLPPKLLLLQVNGGTGSNPLPGISSAFYQEIKFWNYARNVQDIQWTRFNQLDVNIQQSLLFSYMKLANGGFSYADEIDFADPSLSKLVVFSNTKWTVETGLLVCPIGFYHFNSSMNTCYRDGVQSISTYIYKSATNYTIVTYNLTFNSYYISQFYSQIYDLGWSLNQVLTKSNATDIGNFPKSLSPQASNLNLVFANSQVANNPGMYNLSFSLLDKSQYQQHFYSPVILKTLSCLSLLIDNQNEDSTVYVDLGTQMGMSDALIAFASTNCLTYQFDLSQIVILYANNSQLPKTSKPVIKGTNIVIQSQDHQYMTYASYQAMTIDYAWKNSIGQKDSIGYRKNVYFRFIPTLTVALQTNNSYLIKGETMLLTNTGTQLTNTNQGEQIQQQWICPGSLNSFCSSQSKSSNITITYSQFEQSSLSPFTYYTFQLIGSFQNLDLNIQKTITQSVTVVWIPFKVSAQIVGPLNPVASMVNVYQFINQNGFTDQDVNVQWTVNPSIDNSYLVNSNNRWQFVVDKYGFKIGQPYVITANLYYSSNNWNLWNSTYIVQVSTPPNSGALTVTPSSGTAYSSLFTLSVTGWKASFSPIQYQYGYLEPQTGTFIKLSPLTQNTSFSMYLSDSVTYISILVIDSQWSSTQVNQSVTVNSQTSSANSLTVLANSASNSVQALSYQMIQLYTILTQSMNTFKASFSESQQQDYYLQIVQNIQSQVKNFDTLNDANSQRYLIQGSVKVLKQITNNQSRLNLTVSDTLQDTILTVLEIQNSQLNALKSQASSLAYSQYSTTIFGNFTQDSTFLNNFLAVQANMLSSLQNMYSEGSIDSFGQDNLLTNVTTKMRTILMQFEAINSQIQYDGYSQTFQSDTIQFQSTKFARYKSSVSDYSQSLPMNLNSLTSNDTLTYSFPLSQAQQPTERQTFSIITYKVNPFFGSYQMTQQARANQSIYFSYRDSNGNYLGGDYLSKPVNLTFPFYYDDNLYFPNKTLCGYLSQYDTTWGNQTCLTSFDREHKTVHCSCQHMSTYSVLQVYLKRPTPTPLIYLQFQNWPSFIAFIYMILVFIFGVIYTFNRDHQDFRNLHEQEEHNNGGMPLKSDDSITLNSIAFKRQVFYMAFGADFNFLTLYRLFIMQMHPLLQLRYNLDPQIPRFFKFLVLYTRQMILLLVSFILMRDYPNFDELSMAEGFSSKVLVIILFIIIGSIVLIPLPISFLCCFKARYYLSHNKDNLDDEIIYDDAEKQKQLKETLKAQFKEKVYIDPTIPIRLLFLINTVSLVDMHKNYKAKIPYASGSAKELGLKLEELDEDPDNLVSGEFESENSNRDLASERDSNRPGSQSDHGRNQPSQALPIVASHSLRQDMFQSQYRTHIQGNMNPGIEEEEGNSYDVPPDDNADEEEKYNSDARFIGVNKTESKMIDPSHIQFELNDNDENLIDDDSEYKEGGEESPKNSKPEQQRPTNMSSRGPGRQASVEMEFEVNGSRRSQQVNPQQQVPRQDSSSGSGTSISDTTMNTQDFIVNKKELSQERNCLCRILGILLALIINIAIIYYIAYLYMSEKYYNSGYQYVWVVVFFLAQIVGFFITDFIALLVMAASVALCCRKKKTLLAFLMRESLVRLIFSFLDYI